MECILCGNKVLPEENVELRCNCNHICNEAHIMCLEQHRTTAADKHVWKCQRCDDTLCGGAVQLYISNFYNTRLARSFSLFVRNRQEEQKQLRDSHDKNISLQNRLLDAAAAIALNTSLQTTLSEAEAAIAILSNNLEQTMSNAQNIQKELDRLRAENEKLKERERIQRERDNERRKREAEYAARMEKLTKDMYASSKR